jgi:hypothetical protein
MTITIMNITSLGFFINTRLYLLSNDLEITLNVHIHVILYIGKKSTILSLEEVKTMITKIHCRLFMMKLL